MNLRLFALGTATVILAGSALPAAAADKETRQMMSDIRMLQEQEQQIESQVTALIDALKTSDAQLGKRIDDQTEATRRALADEKTVTSSIASDLRSVREKLDDNTTRVGSMTLEIQSLRQLITARTSFGAPDSAAPSAPAGAGAPSDSAAASVPPAADSPSPTALFDSAYSDYTTGNYDLAIDGFKAYINSFPAAPQAADAQVNICNSYLNKANYQQAADACDTAIRNYPKATVIPTAYYRKGLALKKLNEPDQANAAFNYVIKTWPDSTEATLAQQNVVDPKKP
jgi:TolA-binding protein